MHIQPRLLRMYKNKTLKLLATNCSKNPRKGNQGKWSPFYYQLLYYRTISLNFHGIISSAIRTHLHRESNWWWITSLFTLLKRQCKHGGGGHDPKDLNLNLFYLMMLLIVRLVTIMIMMMIKILIIIIILTMIPRQPQDEDGDELADLQPQPHRPDQHRVQQHLQLHLHEEQVKQSKYFKIDDPSFSGTGFSALSSAG